ncbi:MAG TPA: tetratricopeptide repeat protein [Trichormus sp.]|jgi:tetratricopeptide (TPR) repeat protein
MGTTAATKKTRAAKALWLFVVILCVFSSLPTRALATTDESQAHMLKGSNAAAESDWTMALNEFLLAVGADDHNAAAIYEVGIAYFHLGRLPKAQLAEEIAIQVDEKFMPAYIELATVHSKQGQYSQAKETIERALKLWPDNPDLTKALASIAKVEATSQAAPVTGTASGAAPLVVSPLAKNALLYSRKDTAGLCRESETSLQQGDLQRAKSALQFALKLEPADPELHWRLCNVLESEGNTTAAVAEAQQAVNLDPDNTQWYLALGWAFSRQAKWQQSADIFKQAYERDNDLHDAVVGECYALAKQKQFTLARIILHVSDPAARDTSWYHEASGLLLEEKGDLIGAYKECSRAAEIAPNDYQIKYTLSRVAYQLACKDKKVKERWRQAAQHARDLLAYTPCDVEILVNLGVCLQESDDNDAALKTLAKAIKISPGNAGAHGAYAAALATAGKVDQAREQAKLAKKIDPSQKLAESVLQRLK